MESEKLPADMMLEILSRASFETVERCKVVSKALRRMIYDPTFLSLRCKRTNSVFGYYFDSLFVSDGGTTTSINQIGLPSHNMRILASCDHGILCCNYFSLYESFRYYVCKPATNQLQALPNPKYSDCITLSCSLIVVESRPLHYKIVRLSRDIQGYIWEIFDSRNWKWKKTQGTNLTTANGNTIRFMQPAVCVGKYVHYLTKNDNVLVFDVNKRSFRCFPLPKLEAEAEVCFQEKKLVKYEGGLGFSCISEDWNRMENWNRMDVWVANLKWQRWTKMMSVDMNIFLQKNLFHVQLVEFITTDVAFMKTASGGVFWNFRDGSFNNINVSKKGLGCVFRFQSDFQTVHLKGINWYPSLIRKLFCF